MLCLLVEALYSCLRCVQVQVLLQVRGVGTSHQGALHTKTLIHHILGPVHSGFEPELEFP